MNGIPVSSRLFAMVSSLPRNDICDCMMEVQPSPVDDSHQQYPEDDQFHPSHRVHLELTCIQLQPQRTLPHREAHTRRAICRDPPWD